MLLIAMVIQPQGMATALCYRERKPARSLPFTGTGRRADRQALTETTDEPSVPT